MDTLFPQLAIDGYKVTSPETINYNCIAWAAKDTTRWWWPDPFNIYYWPNEATRTETLDAFVEAFSILGYEICESHEYEPSYEKIALFARMDGKPTHASRQLDNGKWTSKLGRSIDIEHRFKALEGPAYGSIVVIMKKAREI